MVSSELPTITDLMTLKISFSAPYPIFAGWQYERESRLNSILHSELGSNKENVYICSFEKLYTDQRRKWWQ